MLLISSGISFVLEDGEDGILPFLILVSFGAFLLIYSGVLNYARGAFQEKVKEIKKKESELYTHISKELDNGIVDKGLWTQAEGESGGGDEKKVKSIYIKLRYKQLSRE